MKKLLGLIVIVMVMAVTISTANAATFVTQTGSFKVFIVDDPNYDADGTLKAGKSPVILYQVDIRGASDYQRTILFERPVEWNNNDFVLQIRTANALVVEGTYELTVRTVNVVDGTSYSRPPVVVHTIVVDFPEPTPTPTETPEPTATETPVPPEPTATPTATPLPLPDVLLEDNFQFEDIVEEETNFKAPQAEILRKR